MASWGRGNGTADARRAAGPPGDGQDRTSDTDDDNDDTDDETDDETRGAHVLVTGDAGLAQAPDLGEHVLACWDGFLALLTDPRTDLSKPSRLKGWTGLDVAIHLGLWDDNDPVAALTASARQDGRGEVIDTAAVDAKNAALLRAHRGVGVDEAVAACERSRASVHDFLGSPLDEEIGLALTNSSLGPVPVRTILNAGTYELAVHALDLAPCGTPRPPDHMLDRGLSALLDVTGGLSSRLGVEATVTAMAPTGGWRFTSTREGWTTERAPAGKVHGTGVSGDAAVLLDVSAGRANLPQLLLGRKLQVHDLPSFMRLAPLLNEVPGIPGGAALRGAVGGLGRVRRLLRLG